MCVRSALSGLSRLQGDEQMGWIAAGEEVTEDEDSSLGVRRRPCTGEADVQLGRERTDVQNLEEVGLMCE